MSDYLRKKKKKDYLMDRCATNNASVIGGKSVNKASGWHISHISHISHVCMLFVQR